MANKIFSRVPIEKVGRSNFDLSHERKFTTRFGKLVPCGCWEVLPKDTWSCNSEVFLRFMPMLAPIMHEVNVYVHYFFVPNRLVYADWEKFITGGDDGHFGDKDDVALNPAHTAPYYNTNNITNYATLCTKKTLWDYLGLPSLTTVSSASSVHVSALPFRAYAKIYNDWYRDENLVPEIPIPMTGGNVTSEFNTGAMGVLRTRAWEKDYFTSALPFTQKGTPLSLNLSGSNAPVVYSNPDGNPAIVRNAPTGAPVGGDLVSAPNTGHFAESNSGPASLDPNGSLYADLSSATIASINELREAFQVQKFLERQALGGSRYVESLLTHFSVRSSDARLQRSEYLGGGKANVIISEVLQQSQSTEDSDGDVLSAQGNMAGHGVSVGKSNRWRAFFEEHGWVIGIMSIMPRSAYQQGIPRQFSREDKFDYAWPLLAHLGQQEVKNKEVYYTGAGSNRPEVDFGYQNRYQEYRYIPSTVHGDLKDTLSFWHLGRIFSALPSLNQDFIECKDASLNGIFPVMADSDEDSNDKIIVDVYHNIMAKRPLPLYGTPAGI